MSSISSIVKKSEWVDHKVILRDNKSGPWRWLRDQVSVLNHYTILSIEFVVSIIF